jgi:hypothetical protein
MAAYWQGYGTLGVGEEAGSVTWGARSLSLSENVSQKRSEDMAVEGGRRESSGTRGNLLSAFAGQGNLPYQVAFARLLLFRFSRA